MEFIISKYNYWIYIILMMVGFYAMIGKRNLVKKLVGMNIFQTAIILYFISIFLNLASGGGMSRVYSLPMSMGNNRYGCPFFSRGGDIRP